MSPTLLPEEAALQALGMDGVCQDHRGRSERIETSSLGWEGEAAEGKELLELGAAASTASLALGASSHIPAVLGARGGGSSQSCLSTGRAQKRCEDHQEWQRRGHNIPRVSWCLWELFHRSARAAQSPQRGIFAGSPFPRISAGTAVVVGSRWECRT